MQLTSYEPNHKDKEPELSLGVLPLSYSYALIVTGHTVVYRGDGLVVFPGFDLYDVLQMIQDYKLSRLWMAPPMAVAMIKATAITKKYDLMTVKTAIVGASNLTREVFQQFAELSPSCSLVQGYCLTEAAMVVCFQNPHDSMFGSCPHILPGYEARFISNKGEGVTGNNKPGELLLR